jgi:hypothetical protein
MCLIFQKINFHDVLREALILKRFKHVKRFLQKSGARMSMRSTSLSAFDEVAPCR